MYGCYVKNKRINNASANSFRIAVDTSLLLIKN